MAARRRQLPSHDRALAVRSRQPEEPMLSRPPESGPHAKCDDRMDVPVSGELKARAARLARLKGYASAAAYARQVIEHQILLDEAEVDRIVSQTGGNVDWRNGR